jgi:hypothetical protein
MLQQQHGRRNPNIPDNSRAANNLTTMGSCGEQGMKRMRDDDCRPDGASAPRRIEWNAEDKQKSYGFHGKKRNQSTIPV